MKKKFLQLLLLTFCTGIIRSQAQSGPIYVRNATPLAGTQGATSETARFQFFSANSSTLLFYGYRHTAGTDWHTATTRILARTDVSNQAYIDFNPAAAPLGLALGTSGKGNSILINTDGSVNIASPGRMHVSGGELLYLLNKSGVIISRAWGGNGNLTVEGAILSSKVKVAVPGGANWNFASNNNKANWGWADYVFDKEYKLLSLAEVEKYIEQNKHLPNIPTANEVKKEGIDLGEMNAKLLEKIEELTLYMIEMKKTIDVQNKKIELLENKGSSISNKQTNTK
jgi:hypothetical protein